MLNAISPIDGRYESKTQELQFYFSESALIKRRILVEVKYFIELSKLDIENLPVVSDDVQKKLLDWASNIEEDEVVKVKEIEKTTNHDVKAVEYIVKEKLEQIGLAKYKEWVHFGLTSQDINNTAFPMMIHDAMEYEILPFIQDVCEAIEAKSEEYKGIPMLARTHGQPASPTTLGKEFRVFSERILKQIEAIRATKIEAKFGGATGNFNAHLVALKDIDWKKFGDSFVKNFGLNRQQTTTQIAQYDDLAQLFDCMCRTNVILIDFCRDIWTYISMDYFKQKIVAGEIGSSAMPHKVNPIDFENAEGNLGMANAVFKFLSSKLPISRLQRDLTDSTVLRNVGVPFAHTLIAMKSILKGISKLELHQVKLNADLSNNVPVLAEAVQTILRRENYPSPYEALKELTRKNKRIDLDDLHAFIDSLDISDQLKAELKILKPENYIGYL